MFGDIPQLLAQGRLAGWNEPKAILAWDINAIGRDAGLLALGDTGIPLTPVEQIGKVGCA